MITTYRCIGTNNEIMKLIKNRTAKRHKNEKWNSKPTIMIR